MRRTSDFLTDFVRSNGTTELQQFSTIQFRAQNFFFNVCSPAPVSSGSFGVSFGFSFSPSSSIAPVETCLSIYRSPHSLSHLHSPWPFRTVARSSACVQCCDGRRRLASARLLLRLLRWAPSETASGRSPSSEPASAADTRDSRDLHERAREDRFVSSERKTGRATIREARIAQKETE